MITPEITAPPKTEEKNKNMNKQEIKKIEFTTITALAELMSLSKPTVRKMLYNGIQCGKIHEYRPTPQCPRYDLNEVLSYMAQHK